MSDSTHAFDIPPGTYPIVRSATAVGATALDTVPAGKRWNILSAYITGTSTVAGTISITANPSYDATSRTLLALNLPTTGTDAISLTCVVSYEAGMAIAVASTATATFTAGISGYEEPQL